MLSCARGSKILSDHENETSERAAELAGELEACRRELNLYRTWVPPGDALSPIPSLAEVKDREKVIYAVSRHLPGIDLNEAGQLLLFDELRKFYPEQPFPEQKTENRRYWFRNPAYSYSDAILLYCLMRYLRPRRIIEVGSGYSSAAILDTNELFFNNSIECTFVEPQPQLLHSLLKDQDRERIQLQQQKLQNIDPDLFAGLEANDILFIDSSHV